MAASAPDPIETLNRAIDIVGSQTALGRLLGVSQMSVSRWSRGLVAFPPEHVLTVERETGISRHELRPDVYGPAPNAQPQRPGGGDQLEPAR